MLRTIGRFFKGMVSREDVKVGLRWLEEKLRELLGDEYVGDANLPCDMRFLELYPKAILSSTFPIRYQSTLMELEKQILSARGRGLTPAWRIALGYIRYYLSLIYRRQSDRLRELESLQGAYRYVSEVPRVREVAGLRLEVGLRLFELLKAKGYMEDAAEHLVEAIKDMEAISSWDRSKMEELALLCGLAGEFFLKELADPYRAKRYAKKSFDTWNSIYGQRGDANSKEMLVRAYKLLLKIYGAIRDDGF